MANKYVSKAQYALTILVIQHHFDIADNLQSRFIDDLFKFISACQEFLDDGGKVIVLPRHSQCQAYALPGYQFQSGVIEL